MSRTKWDYRFLYLAHFVSQWSRDPSTKVGAVIARDKKVLGIGYNGFPAGVKDSAERYNHRTTKYEFVVHAERNALDDAQMDLTGATLYCTLSPCHECMKGIIQRKIKRVLYSDFRHDAVSLIMAQEAGVQMVQITGEWDGD